MRTVIYPYKIASKSAKAISTVLDGFRIRGNGTYLPRSGDFIINWGASTIPAWYDALRGVQRVVFLNSPTAVANAANKLRTFRILQDAGVSIPEFTTDIREAMRWPKFYGRRVLTGHSGAGIYTFEPRVDFDPPSAPLYVHAVENHGEYRVHVVNGEVIDYIKKRRRNNEPATDEQNQVRNLANGWIYTRENLQRLERIEQLAIRAVAALGLDFGAVDIIKDENGDVFVLEVNTACGMSDSTLESYAEAFSNLISEHNG